MLGWLIFVLNQLGASERVTVSRELASEIVAAAEAHPYPGDQGAVRMAATLGAMAWHESRFKRDAMGDCRDPVTGAVIVRIDDPRRTVANCKSFGPLQSPLGISLPLVAQYLSVHPLVTYVCPRHPETPKCHALAAHRHALAVRLLYASPLTPLAPRPPVPLDALQANVERP